LIFCGLFLDLFLGFVLLVATGGRGKVAATIATTTSTFGEGSCYFN
jgi:hypothetical protein